MLVEEPKGECVGQPAKGREREREVFGGFLTDRLQIVC